MMYQELVVFYATDVKIDAVKENSQLIINFDGMTLKEEKAFREKCAARNITIYQSKTFGLNQRRCAIISTGGFMDGDVCRPLAYAD